jgi:hypothetical protein
VLLEKETEQNTQRKPGQTWHSYFSHMHYGSKVKVISDQSTKINNPFQKVWDVRTCTYPSLSFYLHPHLCLSPPLSDLYPHPCLSPTPICTLVCPPPHASLSPTGPIPTIVCPPSATPPLSIPHPCLSLSPRPNRWHPCRRLHIAGMKPHWWNGPCTNH